MTKKITDLEGRLDATLKRADKIDYTVRPSISELKEALAEMTRQRDELLSIYSHTHEAHYITVGDKNVLTEQCDRCGLNLRHEIHLRSSVDKSVTNPPLKK